MTDLRAQRRLASELLKCGIHRVRFNADNLEDVAEAVTRADIRKLILLKFIVKRQVRGQSRVRARLILAQKQKGRRAGPGSRKGSSFARLPRKERWMSTIRPIRQILRKLRSDKKIDRRTYRTYYLQAKGGTFKSTGHLVQQLRAKGLIVEATKDPAAKKKRKKDLRIAAGRLKKKKPKKDKKEKTGKEDAAGSDASGGGAGDGERPARKAAPADDREET